MTLSRAEQRRTIRDRRRLLWKRAFWILTAAAIAGTLGVWLWEWTGDPVYLNQ